MADKECSTLDSSDHVFPDSNAAEKQDGNMAEDGGKERGEREKASPEASPREIHGIKWFVSCAALLSSIFLYAFDCTVVADIQALIVAEYDALDKLAWLSNGLVLPATALVIPWGRLYGQFNAKTLYLVCVVLFEAGSALCGGAPTMNALIVGRALAGVGGAGLYMGVMTLLAATTTMAERPMYVGLTGLTWGLGIVLGPIIGGAFSVSAVGWRWAFYINLLVAVPAAPAYLWLLPGHVDPRPAGTSLRARWAEMDYVGNVLLMGAIVTFVLAINWGGVAYAWSAGPVVGCFVAAAVLLALLAVQQTRLIATTAARRILPVPLLRRPMVPMLFVCCACGGASAFVPIYFVPTFFQFAHADSALDAGVRLLPLIVVMVVVILLNGHLMGRLGYYTPWFGLGGLLATAGAALLYTVRLDTAPSRIYGYTALLGAGVGMWLQAPFSVAQAVVAPADVPAAVGIVMLGQFVGITVALAIANTVFLNDAERGIQALLPHVDAATIQRAMEGAAGGFLESLDEDVRTRVLDVIVRAMDKAYILVMAAGSLTAVLSLFMKHNKLFGSTVAAAA